MNNLKAKITFWKNIIKLKGTLDAWEYKNIFLSLFFLKYTNWLFLQKWEKQEEGFLKNLKENYHQDMIIFFPENIRWENLLNIKNPEEIKEKLDQTFRELINQNKEFLDNTFENNFFQKYQNIKSSTLVSLIKVIEENFENLLLQKENVLDFFQYFLKQFALSSGKKSGEFYTPSCVVELLVSLIEPREGTLYDPCFGYGWMFIKTFDYLKNNVYQNLNEQKRNEALTKLEIYGQEKNRNSWRLGKLNLLLHHLSTQKISKKPGCTFLNDQYHNMTFDYVLAEPEFNLKEYWNDKLMKDLRWEFGIPLKKNANYGWVQHIISKLNENGVGCFLMPIGSLTEKKTKKIRAKIIEKNLIEAIIMLPERLFLKTQISACIWIVRKNRIRKDILFINGENFRTMKEKTIYYMSNQNIKSISSLYQDFRKNKLTPIANLCTFVSQSKVADNFYSLLPNQYIEFIDREFENINLNDQIKIKTKKIEDLDNQENKTKQNLQKIISNSKKLIKPKKIYHIKKIKNLVKITQGRHFVSPSKTEFLDHQNGFLWLKIADIKPYIYDSTYKLSQKGVETTKNAQKFLFKKDSFVMAIQNSIGKIGWLENKFYSSNVIANFDCDDLILKKYLYYYFKKNHKKLFSLRFGTSIKRIELKQIEELEINLPDRETQKKIVEELDFWSQRLKNLKEKEKSCSKLIKLIIHKKIK